MPYLTPGRGRLIGGFLAMVAVSMIVTAREAAPAPDNATAVIEGIECVALIRNSCAFPNAQMFVLGLSLRTGAPRV